MDVSVPLSDLLPALHATSFGSLPFWTEAELYAYADEGLKRLARQAQAFPVTGSVSVTAGTRVYTLPSRTVSVAGVAFNSAELKPAGAAHLEARSATWESDSGTPSHYTLDLVGLKQVALWPVPDAGGTLNVVVQEYPAPVTSSSPTVTAPGFVEDWIYFTALADARRKEGEGQMQDIAEFADAMAGLLLSAAQAYYGEAQ